MRMRKITWRAFPTEAHHELWKVEAASSPSPVTTWKRWKEIAPRLLSYSFLNRASTNVSGGPGVKEFVVPGSLPTPAEDRTPLAPYLEENHISGRGRKGECKPLNAVYPNTDKDGRCGLLYFSSQCIWRYMAVR